MPKSQHLKTEANQSSSRKLGLRFAWISLSGTIACFVLAFQKTFESFSEASTLFFLTFLLLLLTVYLFYRSKEKMLPPEEVIIGGKSNKGAAGRLHLRYSAVGILICLILWLHESQFSGSNGMSGLLELMIILIVAPISLVLALIGLGLRLSKKVRSHKADL